MANNPYVNKVQLADGTVLIDISVVTVTPSSLMEGYTAIDASGTSITGTAKGGGLEYETGTFSPVSDIANTTISLANTHTAPPFAYAIFDCTGSETNTSDDNLCLMYFNGGQFFGTGYYISSTNIQYANAAWVYKNSATTESYGSVRQTKPYNDPDDSSSACSRYWATETTIRASVNNRSRYWRAGRTYKWVAVWKPST